MRKFHLVPAVLLAAAPLLSQRYLSADGSLRVALVKMPYTGARNVSELPVNSDYLERGGLASLLANKRVSLRPTSTWMCWIPGRFQVIR